MAMLVDVNEYGIDVAKDWLDIFDGTEVIRIDNQQRAIKAFLKQLSSSSTLAVESTNTYHELLVEMAIAAKHMVYLIDAYRLSRYRDAVGVRAKTDANDARLLLRYLRSEKQQLVAFKPIPKAVKRLNRLLKARAKLAGLKASMGLALGGIAELAQTRQALLKRFKLAMSMIDKRILNCIILAGYKVDYQRCLAVPGIGHLNAAALVAMYHRGYFPRSDCFIAFMGLDVRVRESGYYKGKRKLTKKGSPEMRRLLFNAARAGAKTKQWNAFYLAMRARGHSTTATAVALSRKIARLAFALMRDQSEYRPI
jgi:transposase